MFDIDSCRISDSPAAKFPALFKTADKYSYDVYPCACLFAGKPHSGKSIYLPYAAKRWKNNQEAFGLVPVSEISAVCFALDRGEIIQGVECINPFNLKIHKSDTFSQFIEQLCASGS